MDASPTVSGHEPRWPAALAVAAVIGVLSVLPGRLTVLPQWFIYVVGVLVLAPMAAVVAMSARPRWVRLERIVILVFFVLATIATLSNLVSIVHTMIHKMASTLLFGLIALAMTLIQDLDSPTFGGIRTPHEPMDRLAATLFKSG
jgi:hypothetical protein